MKYREYAYTGRWADGSLHTDTVYVAHPEPTPAPMPSMTRNDHRIVSVVYNVQDYPSERLASTMDRQAAGRWLRIRRLAGRCDCRAAEFNAPAHASNCLTRHPGVWNNELRIGEGWISRRISEYVPNMPVDEYARPNTVVLHDDGDGGMSGYGYKSGETAEGVRYTEQRLDSSGYDDFHFYVECDTHGTELVPNGSTDEECPDCEKVLDCINGNCDCIDRLEACSICDRPQGDGDTVWLCLDGGEIICPEHVVVDERPDSLFKKVGGVRGASLPAFAFPGGYCIVYLTRHNNPLCAECASKVDTSDPAVEAYVDEEMNCLDCEHAQSFHSDNPDGVSCEYGHDGPDNDEQWHLCNCTQYNPPLCEDCNKPIDPAMRAKEAVTA